MPVHSLILSSSTFATSLSFSVRTSYCFLVVSLDLIIDSFLHEGRSSHSA